jgi:hypothetical protein
MGDKDYNIDPLRNKIIFTFLDRLKNTNNFGKRDSSIS